MQTTDDLSYEDLRILLAHAQELSENRAWLHILALLDTQVKATEREILVKEIEDESDLMALLRLKENRKATRLLVYEGEKGPYSPLLTDLIEALEYQIPLKQAEEAESND